MLYKVGFRKLRQNEKKIQDRFNKVKNNIVSMIANDTEGFI